MELALLLYAASIAQNLRSGMGFFVFTFAVLAVVSLVAMAIATFSADEESPSSDRFATLRQAHRLARKSFTWLFFGWTALVVLSHLVPTRKEVYIMAAGYVALKAANSQVVQSTADSMLGSIDRWLDKELARDQVVKSAGKAQAVATSMAASAAKAAASQAVADLKDQVKKELN